MGLGNILSVGLMLLAFGLAAALLGRQRSLSHRLAETEKQRDRALAAEAATGRLLRLSANELREIALSLQGQAERLRAMGADPTCSGATAIAAVTAQVLRLADDLQDAAVPRAETRVIRDETLSLGELVQDAIAAVGATLDPSRRNWRIAPEVCDTTLTADRRAVAQILVRVLGNAGRFTRDGDWIEVGLERREGEIAVIVADEGSGLAAIGPAGRAAANDGRGIGLGLALARVLMEAHGGTLAVETVARVGTRVILGFPASRVGSLREVA